MRVAILGAGPSDDRDVRLRRRLVVQGQGILPADGPAGRERSTQRVARHLDARRVLAALRLGDDQLAGDELDRIALEGAEVNEPLVFTRPQRRSVRGNCFMTAA